MEVAARDRRRRRRLPRRLPPRQRARGRAGARRPGARAGARAVHRRHVAADGELRRRRRHDRPLDRGARDDPRAARRPPAARRLPRLVPPLGLRRRRDRPGGARRVPRRARRVDRPRPAARAARQRRRGAVRLEPRPAREHPRGRARREARRLPRRTRGSRISQRSSRQQARRTAAPTRTRSARRRSSTPAGLTCTPSGRRSAVSRHLDMYVRDVSAGRYRWVVLAAGTLAQASFSASSVGLPALGPALKSHYGLTLGETGVVLGAIGIGMLFTLLPWGLVADRVDERWVIATGLTGRRGPARRRRLDATRFASVAGALVGVGALGASVNAASGRAIMAWFPSSELGLALGIRQTAIPIGGARRSLAPARARLGRRHPHGLPLPRRRLRDGSGDRRGLRPRRRRLGARARRRDSARCATRECGCSAAEPASTSTAQIGITGFVVLFLHEHRHVSTHAAAALLAAINVLAIAARIGSGRISDRLGSRLVPLRAIGVGARRLHRRSRRSHRGAAGASSSRSSSSPACSACRGTASPTPPLRRRPVPLTPVRRSASSRRCSESSSPVLRPWSRSWPPTAGGSPSSSRRRSRARRRDPAAAARPGAG